MGHAIFHIVIFSFFLPSAMQGCFTIIKSAESSNGSTKFLLLPNPSLALAAMNNGSHAGSFVRSTCAKRNSYSRSLFSRHLNMS
ncbi:hypothetical protein EDB89DRAFT_958067 [Lactarius sanguifluus]|nr:hypothetical protein EDB89DRAFT_958067 [Lactarius sanguifluus]